MKIPPLATLLLAVSSLNTLLLKLFFTGCERGLSTLCSWTKGMGELGQQCKSSAPDVLFKKALALPYLQKEGWELQKKAINFPNGKRCNTG